MIDMETYAPRSWSPKARRLYNIALHAHIRALDLSHRGQVDRSEFYRRIAGRLWMVFEALPASETPPEQGVA